MVINRFKSIIPTLEKSKLGFTAGPLQQHMVNNPAKRKAMESLILAPEGSEYEFLLRL